MAFLGFGREQRIYLRRFEAVLVLQDNARLEQAIADFIHAFKRAGAWTCLGFVVDDLGVCLFEWLKFLPKNLVGRSRIALGRLIKLLGKVEESPRILLE